MTVFGKVVKICKKPGLYWYAPIFRGFKTVSLAIKTTTVKEECPDLTGAPIKCDAAVIWCV